MFNFFKILLRAGVKKVAKLAKAPLNTAKSWRKAPLKNLKKAFNLKEKFGKKVKALKTLNKKKTKKSEIKKSAPAIKKTGTTNQVLSSSTDGLTPKEKKIADIVAKSNMIESMQSSVGEILRGKSSADIEADEIIKDINKNPKQLEMSSNEDLDNLTNMLDKTMEDLHIDPNDFKEMSKEEYYDTANLNAFESYLDNWKEKFYDSDTTDHLSESEKDEIWEEIESTRTYEWFTANKLGE